MYQTASQKRRKEKLDKAGYIPDLEKFLKENLKTLKELPSNKLIIEKVEEGEGDKYYYENRYGHIFKFNDGTEYCFMHIRITEDSDDWAQAESYEYHSLWDIKENTKITVNEVINKLKTLL